MKISLICTVKNEEKSIRPFLESLFAQSRKPDEVVIVDGGSRDGTVGAIKEFQAKGYPIKLIVEKDANISKGRNIAIRNSSYNIIASTDAGCRLDKKWLEKITKPFQDSEVDVVSGFYLPDPKTSFEECAAVFTHPRLEKIDQTNFLPSSRSVAFKKEAWERAGGYPEHLYTAEDTLFDINLKKARFKFKFQPKAIVYWQPRSSWKTFAKQIFLYSKGDAQAKTNSLIYLKLFGRYSLGLTLLIIGFFYWFSWLILSIGVIAYFLKQPFAQAKKISMKALVWLIPLKLTSDMAQALGYLSGKFRKPIRG